MWEGMVGAGGQSEEMAQRGERQLDVYIELKVVALLVGQG